MLAAGKERIGWDEVRRAEIPYSSNRLLALRDEWKPNYPDIDKVFRLFEGCNEALTPQEFILIAQEAVLLPVDYNFQGAEWMNVISAGIWTSRGETEWQNDYLELVRLLFNIGFLGVTTASGKSTIYAHDDPQFLEKASNFYKVASFSVHPAFRAALDIHPTGRHRKR